jgi:hypothetical protein|eukprot:COSAG01_NODE_9553_length_2410_cov_2.836505_2_plen_129_part_00
MAPLARGISCWRGGGRLAVRLGSSATDQLLAATRHTQQQQQQQHRHSSGGGGGDTQTRGPKTHASAEGGDTDETADTYTKQPTHTHRRDDDSPPLSFPWLHWGFRDGALHFSTWDGKGRGWGLVQQTR